MTDYRQWKTAVSTPHTDFETLKHYRFCGIQAVELSVGWQSCDGIDWADFRKNADAAGIEICSYHLPFSDALNIAAPVESAREYAVNYQKAMIDKAVAVGIHRFIIHPSAEPIPDKQRSEWMAAAKKSLADLAEYAAERSSVICVEDLPRTCLGHTVEEMQELISADERLMVCFDVNHLLTDYGSTHKEFAKALGSRIITTHMSDYDFVDEKHFFPGYGMLDWKSVVEALEEADYDGPFLYEGGFSASGWMPQVPFGTIEMARYRHMHRKELTGKDSVG